MMKKLGLWTKKIFAWAVSPAVSKFNNDPCQWNPNQNGQSPPHGILAHAFPVVWALLPARAAKQACGDDWHYVLDDVKRIEFAKLLNPQG